MKRNTCPSSCSCRDLPSPALIEALLKSSRRAGDIGERLEQLGGLLAEKIPCIVDEFSALRYARQILASTSLPGAQCRPSQDRHPLMQAAAGRLCRPQELPGTELSRLLRVRKADTLDLYSLLFCLQAKPAAAAVEDLLARTGESPYTDLLIKENLSLRTDTPAPQRRKLLLNRRCPGQALLLLELIAELNPRVLADADYEDVAARFAAHPEVLCALIRTAGTRGLPLPDFVRGCAARWSELSEEVRLYLLAALASRADRESLGLMKQLPRRGPALSSFQLIRDFAAAAYAAPSVRPRNGGLRLVQTVVNANPQQGGLARAGGLHTFLSGLGRNLCERRSIEQVVTAEIIPWNRMNPVLRLKEASDDPCYFRLRVPVPFLDGGGPADMARAESAIGYFLGVNLNLLGVVPGLVHARFTDSCARAAFLLAERLGARKVFTLTPDPHRFSCGRRGRLRVMGRERALSFLHRVDLADWLIRRADGLLGIAHENGNTRLLSYFPALCLDGPVRAKPLKLIPEGIDLSEPRSGGKNKAPLSLLSRHSGSSRLKAERSGLPVILNVGRLLPAKGQHLLVRAWAESDLGRHYNLVLVGGDLENPGRGEEKMIRSINRTLTEHPELEGGFSHLSSLSNDRVRRLERALAKEKRGGLPPVYVCSSLKEEFGISILEALAAGFLVFAPREGGVAGYLEHGKNGFLMDTHRAGSMRAALEAVLLPPVRRDAELTAIAEAGRRLVREHFDIRALAVKFEEFYLQICKLKGEK